MDLVDFIRAPKVDNVSLRRRGRPYVEGTLVVTGHHLIFSSRTDHTDELIVRLCNYNLASLTIVTFI